MDEAAISRRAGPAARAKKASEAADQMEVARVLKPIGLKIRVAGSSFMVSRNTRAAPAMIPGCTSGTVIESEHPRRRPPQASGRFFYSGIDLKKDALAAPTAGDRNSTR